MNLLHNIFNILRVNRRNWKAVVLCVCAAMIFWFFNALNKTYTTNINFPLAFEYDNEHFIPVGGLPEQVRLNVTGNGWELFKRSTGLKTDPLQIPLEHPAETKKIVGRGSGLAFTFSSQLEGLEINHILNDTIYLDLEPKIGRWVKLAVDSIEYNLKTGYGLTSEVAIIPDSTYLEGPKRLIEKIEEPVRLNISRHNLDEQYVENIPIEVPFGELITRQPSAVSVMFNVEEMITVQDSVPLALENIPAAVLDVMMAEKIPVTLKVPERFVTDLRVDSLRAVLDLKGFERGSKKILPRVDGLPPFSSVEKIDSVIVSL